MRQISECLPAWLTAEIEARNRGSDERAPARPAVGKGGDGSLEGGETTVAYAHPGEVSPSAIGIESGGATELSPAKLLPLWNAPQGGKALGRVRKALREMTTVNTAATEGTPRPSAVVISLNAWKMAHSAGSRRSFAL